MSFRSVMVVSVLWSASSVGAAEIRDVKGPVDIPNHWLALAYALGALLLLIGGGFLWSWFLEKRTQPPPPKPLPPPWERAYARLKKLKDQDLPAKGLIDAYFTELSDIVRRYLEEQAQIPAPEMTTEEFFVFMEGSEKLTGDQKFLLRDFLRCCDMVKFARYSSSPEEIEKSFDAAKKVVDETHSPSDPAAVP